MRIIIFSFICFSLAWAEVDPPNYDFSLDQLQYFFPHTKLEVLKQNHGEGKKIKTVGETELWRYEVKYLRYAFPVVIQVDKEKILDMHATMPSYFLHNIFHQSLINRFGKQSLYRQKGEEGYYEWKEHPEFFIAYNASCTITCFPTSLSLSVKADRDPSGFKSQLSMMDEALLTWIGKD